jgi:hypothetical protein
MEKELLNLLKGVRLKRAKYLLMFQKPPSHKMAKLKGAEETILTILEHGKIENLLENLKV